IEHGVAFFPSHMREALVLEQLLNPQVLVEREIDGTSIGLVRHRGAFPTTVDAGSLAGPFKFLTRLVDVRADASRHPCARNQSVQQGTTEPPPTHRVEYLREAAATLRQRIDVAALLFVLFMGIGTLPEVMTYPARARTAWTMYVVEAV